MAEKRQIWRRSYLSRGPLAPPAARNGRRDADSGFWGLRGRTACRGLKEAQHNAVNRISSQKTSHLPFYPSHRCQRASVQLGLKPRRRPRAQRRWLGNQPTFSGGRRVRLYLGTTVKWRVRVFHFKNWNKRHVCVLTLAQMRPKTEICALQVPASKMDHSSHKWHN